jgi:hypothetical protein
LVPTETRRDATGCGGVNGNGVATGQKTSKFFVAHMEEVTAEHVGLMEFIKSQGG